MRHPARWLIAGVLVLVTIAVYVSAPFASAVKPRILVGTSVNPRNGESNEEAVQRVETELGRKLSALRVYQPWDGYKNFPSPFQLWLRNTGHAMYFSVKSKTLNGQIVPWRNIAAAQPGSGLYDQIVAWADDFKAYGAKIFFIFNHEPEASVSDPMGTSAEYIAAYRHIVDIFRQQGVTNLRYVWTMTNYSFMASDDRAAAKWYPGDGYVDQIGSDVYNWANCRGRNEGWHELPGLLRSLVDFAAQHPDKGIALAEMGSVEDPQQPGRKGDWISQLGTLFQQPGYERFRTVLYFDSRDQNYSACAWYLATSQSSVDGFRSLGEQPYFQRYIRTAG